jgi:hypothetical protein
VRFSDGIAHPDVAAPPFLILNMHLLDPKTHLLAAYSSTFLIPKRT